MQLTVERNIPTLRELALEKMRGAILGLQFRPGERLVERELCERLGVSRTIVREVLRHLEAEGLVQTLQHRGPIVAKPTMEEATQIYELRGMLEALAARACAERPAPAVIASLEEALTNIRKAYAEPTGEDDLLKATTDFYRRLFEAAEKPVAWQIVSSLKARINHLRAITTRSPGRDLAGPKAMASIVEAIKSGNPEGAAEACLEHVGAASRIALDYLATASGREEPMPERGRGRRPARSAAVQPGA